MLTVVTLEGVNGETFHLAGPDAGAEGIYLATDVKGLYDPPVKVVYEEPGNYPGARYLNHRILRRDIHFAVEILNEKNLGADKSWLRRDSAWRKAWAFDRDCKLYVTTEESGTRYLKLRLLESPEVSLYTDPNGETINRVLMVCVAGDPFWYEDDVVYSAVTQQDTTFDPNPLPWPWPKDELPTETLYITVDPEDGKGGLNPTDQYVWLKWTVPGSTEPPAEPYVPGLPWLGAPKSPATIWTIPDYSFEDEEHANRRIRLPGLIGGLRTEEVQKVFIDGLPIGGTFKIGDGEEWSAPLPYNATPNQVRDAVINGLSWISSNDLEVTQERATNEKQTVKVLGGPTSGYFTLTLGNETTGPIPYNATADQVRDALIALDAVGFLDVHVTATRKNETQRVKIVGEPTGGTFTLTLDGYTTDPIPYNATTIQVAAALQALPNIGNLDVFVTGESLFLWGPYRISFIGGLGGVNVNELTGDGSGLTGGRDPHIEVETLDDGGTIYQITFKGELGGLNLPQMVGDASNLGGNAGPYSVEVETTVDGSRPYVLRFTDKLSGIDVPTLQIDTTELIGTGGVRGRVITTTEGYTAPAENCVIDTDPRVEQITSESGSQVWARMNGVRFRHPVPPYTKSKTFEITVSGCKPGQMVTLRIPRPWSRPWGLE